MKNATIITILMFILLAAASATAWAMTMEEANQLLSDASENALAYVYTGDAGSRDAYLEKMKKVDQAIAAFYKKGDRRTAAILKTRRSQMGQVAQKMFNGYEDNDAELGLQARAFQQASDELEGAMQDAVDAQAGYDQVQSEATLEEGGFMVDLMKYQIALTVAATSGVYYASGGPDEQKQLFDDVMSRLDALGLRVQAALEEAGLTDDAQVASLLMVLSEAKQVILQAADRAFPQRETNGKADAAALELFKQAEEKMLNALESE